MARQVITLNDERNALHRELTALRESEQIVLDEVRRERTNFYQTQQVAINYDNCIYYNEEHSPISMANKLELNWNS